VSRTFHHSKSYRRKLPWFKFGGGPPAWLKKKWAEEVRNYHKAEMLRNPEDPFLSNPRRITDLWDWY
jgi:hypothetical protein